MGLDPIHLRQLEHSIKNGTAAQTVPPMSKPEASAGDASASKGTSPDVYRAICEVATGISRDGIAKGRRNEQQGYGFRGIDDVYNALSALLANADLCILPRMLSRSQEERMTAAGKTLFYVVVQADFDFVSARDGSRHTVTMYGEAMDSGDKATNKAMSAAYKYAAMQAFCIPTEGMVDADATTHEPAPKSAPKPPAPIPPKPEPVPAARHSNNRFPAPWTNKGEMRAQFARVRERVGEVVYLAALAKYGVGTDLQWRNTAQKSATENALACFEELLEQAVS